MSGKVFPLQDNQALAVDPRDSVWLSASAGTGKTQVLSARVLRLLLRKDVDPSQILCLTFTKAGAAEMATRVNEVLANWVRMKPTALAADLRAIGAPVDDATQSRARSLFASVLDCPGGGLRIDTIHAFAQWLLAAFPEEAGLAPGTKAMEDRERDILAHEVLAEMLVEWEKGGDTQLLDALALLSIRMGPDDAKAWLMRCAEAREVWFGPAGWPDDLAGRANRLLGLKSDAGPDDLAELCSDAQFDSESLRLCASINAQWSAKTGQTSANACAEWLAAAPAERAAQLDDLFKALFTQKNAPRGLSSLQKIDPSYEEIAARVLASIDRVAELQRRLDFAEWFVPALRIGRRFALRWDEAKKREGLIDFDDQIRRAASLLSRSELSDWIRFKLDRHFDHILIDEAQDTNEAQWSIINALTDDYFAGEGQRGDKLRTVFVVGDYKQAIFRFQGTSPENFDHARLQFKKAMKDAADNARALRGGPQLRELQDLDLGRSYRTAQPILDFVDAAIAGIGSQEFGLKKEAEKHVGFKNPAQVALWDPILPVPDDDADSDSSETWISEPERRMADRIADQVDQWLREGYPLVKDPDNPRNAGPGDIMVLVRKRKELAGLIVARLYAKGIPVAGVDRLRLGEPLAVKDLMAAMRFAAQPLDDMSLANLLVSPLIGWSQDDLLQHGYREKNVRLWDHIRGSGEALTQSTADKLRDLLRLADYEPPQALLHWMLVGPWRGRQSLIARLGREANDPIDELLNAALNYSASHTPSLQGFIRWFDAGETDLKREAGASDGLVRVMTVHGSKGLQSPIVILADATGNPDRAKKRGVSLQEPALDAEDAQAALSVPVPYLSQGDSIEPVTAAEEVNAAEERQEHWRLLYVAMTRAEEALFIGGALGKSEKEVAPDSWYARLAQLMPKEAQEDSIFKGKRVWGMRAADVAAPTWGQIRGGDQGDSPSPPPQLPQWAETPIGPEPRPPRPLAPSSAGDQHGAQPPSSAEAGRDAARRGVVIHSLLERLPEVVAEDRESRAAAWLEKHAADMSDHARAEMLDAALQVLESPDFAAIFSPDALAEIPLAATVDGRVITGIADRLLVTDEAVTVVDFKTTMRPPASLEDIPATTLGQMAAYAAALAVIYPDKAVKAAVLYTHTPQLIAIPEEKLAAYKSQLSTRQESFPLTAVE